MSLVNQLDLMAHMLQTKAHLSGANSLLTISKPVYFEASYSGDIYYNPLFSVIKQIPNSVFSDHQRTIFQLACDFPAWALKKSLCQRALALPIRRKQQPKLSAASISLQA